jgi:hypothetical protein
VSAGVAEKVKLAGKTVAETKKLVDALRAIGPKVLVEDLSSARAILCVRSATEYVTEKTARTAIIGAADGLTQAEANRLADEVVGSFSFGSSEVFKAANELDEEPSAETLVAFVSALLSAVGDMGSFVTSCGPVLAPYGVVSIPAFAGLAEKLGDVGTIGSILNCSYAAVANAVDVATELQCLADDMKTIEEQIAALGRANGKRCETLGSVVDNPALRPLLQASSNTSEERATACYAVLDQWGACLGAERAKRTLSCDECVRACTGIVNAAGPNAYLAPTVQEAAALSNADPTAILSLVSLASANCIGPEGDDARKTCLSECRGQVQDCP